MSEEKKQILKEYQKNYRGAKKSKYAVIVLTKQTDRDKSLIMYD